MADEDRDGDEQRISAVMRIAESLAGGDAREVRDGYAVTGAASSGAFRFRWVAREVEEGRFVVDETVGVGAVAVSSRPMPREEVSAYIDDRRRRIERRIDEIKRELANAVPVLAPAPLKRSDWPRATDPAPPSEIPQAAAQPEATASAAEAAEAAEAGSPAAAPRPATPEGLPETRGDVAETPAGPPRRAERDPEEIFDEIRRMLQES